MARWRTLLWAACLWLPTAAFGQPGRSVHVTEFFRSHGSLNDVQRLVSGVDDWRSLDLGQDAELERAVRSEAERLGLIDRVGQPPGGDPELQLQGNQDHLVVKADVFRSVFSRFFTPDELEAVERRAMPYRDRLLTDGGRRSLEDALKVADQLRRHDGA